MKLSFLSNAICAIGTSLAVSEAAQTLKIIDALLTNIFVNNDQSDKSIFAAARIVAFRITVAYDFLS